MHKNRPKIVPLAVDVLIHVDPYGFILMSFSYNSSVFAQINTKTADKHTYMEHSSNFDFLPQTMCNAIQISNFLPQNYVCVELFKF